MGDDLHINKQTNIFIANHRILQDKQFHLQLKSEQKEIIQNVLERKDSMAVLPTGFGKSMCYVPPFWTVNMAK
jgi:ATP-dependent DNA helicase RecQ